MQTLIELLQEATNENIRWQVYFYVKQKRRNDRNPYIAFSWSASNKGLIPKLVDSIYKCSTDEFLKNDYMLQDYTPNNSKSTIDKTLTTSHLINRNYAHLREALSIAKPYTIDIKKKPKGYIMVGQNRDDEPSYIFIGIGAPVKYYKHAFLNQATMTETNPDIIVIKPYWDIFINGTDCYMKGANAHTFFDLNTFHEHNMGDVIHALELSGLVDNVPALYPKRGRSIFTDIMNSNEDIKKSIQHWMHCAEQHPEDEYFGKLKLTDGKIDLSDTECYLSLIDLLACRYTNDGALRGEIRPINVSCAPQ